MVRALGLACVGLLLGCGPGVGDDSSGEGTGDGSESSGSTFATGDGSGNTEPGSASAGGECDPFPMEGAPCSAAGEFCSTDCSDQCSFCNVLECVDGAWSRVEVPPAPCLDCAEMCPFVVAAGCAGGPPDQAACVMGCEEVRAGPCAIEQSDAFACTGTAPTFACDAEGRPHVLGCEAAFTTLYACLGL